MREVSSAGLEATAPRPVLRSNYCGGWTGKDARRYHGAGRLRVVRAFRGLTRPIIVDSGSGPNGNAAHPCPADTTASQLVASTAEGRAPTRQRPEVSILRSSSATEDGRWPSAA
jgi:hypothetical protein